MANPRGTLAPNGDWMCGCNPPLPAIYLEVKKDNHNKGRKFYACQKPRDEQCGLFIWGEDAEKREKAQFGETLTARRVVGSTTTEPGTTVAPQPPQRDLLSVREPTPPSKQRAVLAQRMYPRLPPPPPVEDDGFEYFDTPIKPKPAQQRPPKKPLEEEEDLYDWEDSDEEFPYPKTSMPPPSKRPRFEFPNQMQDIDYSPPTSPQPPTTRALADPFSTPPKQITHTPNTPPDTRVATTAASKSPSANLLPVSYSLLHQLSPHAAGMGTQLWQAVREHLLRCGRVADGAVKGRDAARVVVRKRDLRIQELERRVRILESEREVDRAVIGALKRNVDVLTGKVKRTDN